VVEKLSNTEHNGNTVSGSSVVPFGQINTRKLTVAFRSFADELNPLKPELNPICYLLALLGAHHFLHVSRIRVKLLTLR